MVDRFTFDPGAARAAAAVRAIPTPAQLQAQQEQAIQAEEQRVQQIDSLQSRKASLQEQFNRLRQEKDPSPSEKAEKAQIRDELGKVNDQLVKLRTPAEQSFVREAAAKEVQRVEAIRERSLAARRIGISEKEAGRRSEVERLLKEERITPEERFFVEQDPRVQAFISKQQAERAASSEFQKAAQFTRLPLEARAAAQKELTPAEDVQFLAGFGGISKKARDIVGTPELVTRGRQAARSRSAEENILIQARADYEASLAKAGADLNTQAFISGAPIPPSGLTPEQQRIAETLQKKFQNAPVFERAARGLPTIFTKSSVYGLRPIATFIGSKIRGEPKEVTREKILDITKAGFEDIARTQTKATGEPKGAAPALFSFTKEAPQTEAAIFVGGSALAGGAVKSLVLPAGKISAAAAAKTALGIKVATLARGPIISGTAKIVAAPFRLIARFPKTTEAGILGTTAFLSGKQAEARGATPEEIAVAAGSATIKSAALVGGFQAGFEKGLPIQITQTTAAGKTVFTGLTAEVKVPFQPRSVAQPLFGKTPSGFQFGTPTFDAQTTKEIIQAVKGGEVIAIRSATDAKILGKNIIEKLPASEVEFAAAKLQAREILAGTKSRFIAKESIITETLQSHELKPEAIKEINALLKRRSSGLSVYGRTSQFGSGSAKAQIAGFEFRTPHDVDLFVQGNREKLTNQIIKIIEKHHGAGFATKESAGLISTNKGHLFDIHDPAEAAQVLKEAGSTSSFGDDLAFGFKPEAKVSLPGGIKGTSLSEEATRKLASGLEIRAVEGQVGFFPKTHRAKDIVDPLVFEKALAASKEKTLLGSFQKQKIESAVAQLEKVTLAKVERLPAAFGTTAKDLLSETKVFVPASVPTAAPPSFSSVVPGIASVPSIYTSPGTASLNGLNASRPSRPSGEPSFPSVPSRPSKPPSFISTPSLPSRAPSFPSLPSSVYPSPPSFPSLAPSVPSVPSQPPSFPSVPSPPPSFPSVPSAPPSAPSVPSTPSPPPTPPPSTPFAALFKGSKRPDVGKLVNEKGFDVFVRRRGLFGKVTARPLLREEALKLGQREVAGTAARTFKLVPSEAAPVEERLPGRFDPRVFRAPKKEAERDVFVQKSRFAISSPGEKREITAKGLEALSRGKPRSLFGGRSLFGRRR